jgi:hypothetical protein
MFFQKQHIYSIPIAKCAASRSKIPRLSGNGSKDFVLPRLDFYAEILISFFGTDWEVRTRRFTFAEGFRANF